MIFWNLRLIFVQNFVFIQKIISHFIEQFLDNFDQEW